jgi:hypothetical protein
VQGVGNSTSISLRPEAVSLRLVNRNGFDVRIRVKERKVKTNFKILQTKKTTSITLSHIIICTLNYIQ